MSDSFTGQNASGSTVTFASKTYSAKEYAGGVIYFEDSALPVLVSTTNPLPVNHTNSLPAGSNVLGQVSLSAAVPAGTNNIGKFDINSMPGSASTTDTVTVKHDVSTLKSDIADLTPKFVAISAASSGNNTLLAAVAAKRILVLAYTLVAITAVNVKLQDGAGGTDLTGLMTLATGIPVSAPWCPVGHFRGSTATLLNLNLSGAVQVSGHLTYVEVT